MAEFLVYNKDHWIDVMIADNNPALNSLDLAKFSTRYKKGDIVQVYEDGTCTEEPAPTSPFVIIKCPKQTIDNKYQEAKIVQKTQKELDDEWIEKADMINTVVDEIMAASPTASRAEVLAEIKAEFIDTYKTTDRREYYFDMTQINTSIDKVIEINTTQFTNIVRSK